MKKQKPKKLELKKVTVTNLSRLGNEEANGVKGGTLSWWVSQCITGCPTCKILSCESVCDTCAANTCDTCEAATCGVCGTWCSECYTQRYC